MRILAISDKKDHSPKLNDRFGNVALVLSCGELDLFWSTYGFDDKGVGQRRVCGCAQSAFGGFENI